MQLPDPSPEFLIKFHLAMMVLWVMVTPITVKYPDAVVWVAIMSQYANFVGHFASYDAARGETALKEEIEELKRLVVALSRP